MLNQESAAPTPTMSQEEVERLRELLEANDHQAKARTKAALERQQQDLEERVLLAARFQDQLNDITYEEHGPIADSWLIIRGLVEKLDRVRRPILVNEQLARAGFDVSEALRADELIIKMLTARLDACELFKAEYNQRLELFKEHLAGTALAAEAKVRDIDGLIAGARHDISRSDSQRAENVQRLVDLGLDLGLAREKAKPTVEDTNKQRRELDYLIEQRDKQTAIIRSNVKQAQIAFAPPREG